jgi:hypothetical protein
VYTRGTVVPVPEVDFRNYSAAIVASHVWSGGDHTIAVDSVVKSGALYWVVVREAVICRPTDMPTRPMLAIRIPAPHAELAFVERYVNECLDTDRPRSWGRPLDKDSTKYR